MNKKGSKKKKEKEEDDKIYRKLKKMEKDLREPNEDFKKKSPNIKVDSSWNELLHHFKKK
jgi:hypothetical protein